MAEIIGKSSDTGIDLGPAKAYAAIIATVAVAFLGAVGVALQSAGVITGEEWVTIAITTIVSTGLVGGATYATPSKVTVQVPAAPAAGHDAPAGGAYG